MCHCELYAARCVFMWEYLFVTSCLCNFKSNTISQSWVDLNLSEVKQFIVKMRCDISYNMLEVSPAPPFPLFLSLAHSTCSSTLPFEIHSIAFGAEKRSYLKSKALSVSRYQCYYYIFILYYIIKWNLSYHADIIIHNSFLSEQEQEMLAINLASATLWILMATVHLLFPAN